MYLFFPPKKIWVYQFEESSFIPTAHASYMKVIVYNGDCNILQHIAPEMFSGLFRLTLHQAE